MIAAVLAILAAIAAALGWGAVQRSSGRSEGQRRAEDAQRVAGDQVVAELAAGDAKTEGEASEAKAAIAAEASGELAGVPTPDEVRDLIEGSK